jgi:hypothetical protein
MPNYQLGKIYRINCLTTGLCYVGSTAQPTLAKRLGDHVKNYKYWLKEGKQYVSSFEIIKNNNYQITLIQDYPCNNRDQLTRQERYWTNQLPCVNIIRNQGVVAELGKTAYKKQYHENHKEQRKHYNQENRTKIAEQNKIYNETHKEQIAEQKKEYYETIKDKLSERVSCECGCYYTYGHRARHLKTQKHLASVSTTN